MDEATTLLIALVIYFGPSIVALSRGRRNPVSVIVINLFLGWTLIGWVIALAMAWGGTTNRQVEKDMERMARAAQKIR